MNVIIYIHTHINSWTSWRVCIRSCDSALMRNCCTSGIAVCKLCSWYMWEMNVWRLGVWCLSVSSGHVCGVWEFRAGCRGQTAGLLPMWPVLPPFLCQYQGKRPHHPLTSQPIQLHLGDVMVWIMSWFYLLWKLMVCDRSVTVFERSWVKAVGECKCVKVTRILKQAINILFDKIKQRSLSNKAAGTATEYIRLLSV